MNPQGESRERERERERERDEEERARVTYGLEDLVRDGHIEWWMGNNQQRSEFG